MATQTVLDDVQEYLKVRTARYKCPDDEDILFVTNYKGSYAQLSVNAIRKLTEKYIRAFDEKRVRISYVIHTQLIIIMKIKILFCQQAKWDIIQWKQHPCTQILMILNDVKQLSV